MALGTQVSSYGYIYETTNRLNAMMYVGQRKGVFKPNYLGSGKIIEAAVRKYGKGYFSVRVIDWAKDAEELDRMENAYIESYWLVYGKEGMYNISDGGHGGFTGYHSQETKDKISKIRIDRGLAKGPNNPRFGKPVEEDTRNKIRRTLIGQFVGLKTIYNKGLSQEKRVTDIEVESYLNNGWVLGMGDDHKNNLKQPKSEDHIRHMRENHPDFSNENNPMFGRHHGIETKKKQRLKKLGRKYIHNLDTKERKMVWPEELTMYLNNGWLNGMGAYESK